LQLPLHLCSYLSASEMEARLILALLPLIVSTAKSQLVETVCHVDGTCIDGDLIDITPAIDANDCLDICQNWPTRECVSWTFGNGDDGCFLFRNKCEIDLVGPCSRPGDCVSGNDENCLKDYDCALPVRCNGPTLHFFDNITSQDACLQSCKEYEATKDLPGEDGKGCPWYTWDVATSNPGYRKSSSRQAMSLLCFSPQSTVGIFSNVRRASHAPAQLVFQDNMNVLSAMMVGFINYYV